MGSHGSSNGVARWLYRMLMRQRSCPQFIELARPAYAEAGERGQKHLLLVPRRLAAAASAAGDPGKLFDEEFRLIAGEHQTLSASRVRVLKVRACRAFETRRRDENRWRAKRPPPTAVVAFQKRASRGTVEIDHGLSNRTRDCLTSAKL